MLRTIPRSLRLLSTSSLPTLSAAAGSVSALVSQESTQVSFLNSEGKKQTVCFSNLFLRDACRGPNCYDPVTLQKKFTTASLIDNNAATTAESVSATEDGVTVMWNDKVESFYSTKFLEHYSSYDHMSVGRDFTTEHKLWTKNTLEGEDLVTSFKDYMSTDAGLLKTLNSLNKFGFAFVSDVYARTTKTLAIEDLAERIGHLRPTFHGELFESKSHAARSTDLHTDMLYLQCVPGYKLIHKVKNDAEGGAHIFVDGFEAAQYVRSKDPDAFQALLTQPVSYSYNGNGYHYHQSRPVLEQEEHSTLGNESLMYHGHDIRAVNYSPRYQTPFETGIHMKPQGEDLGITTPSPQIAHRFMFKNFLRGIELFEEFLNNPENQLRVILPEGQCVFFDNRRILHSRTGFTGESLLKTCYLDTDTVMSKLRELRA